MSVDDAPVRGERPDVGHGTGASDAQLDRGLFFLCFSVDPRQEATTRTHKPRTARPRETTDRTEPDNTPTRTHPDKPFQAHDSASSLFVHVTPFTETDLSRPRVYTLPIAR